MLLVGVAAEKPAERAQVVAVLVGLELEQDCLLPLELRTQLRLVLEVLAAQIKIRLIPKETEAILYLAQLLQLVVVVALMDQLILLLITLVRQEVQGAVVAEVLQPRIQQTAALEIHQIQVQAKVITAAAVNTFLVIGHRAVVAVAQALLAVTHQKLFPQPEAPEQPLLLVDRL